MSIENTPTPYDLEAIVDGYRKDPQVGIALIYQLVVAKVAEVYPQLLTQVEAHSYGIHPYPVDDSETVLHEIATHVAEVFELHQMQFNATALHYVTAQRGITGVGNGGMRPMWTNSWLTYLGESGIEGPIKDQLYLALTIHSLRFNLHKRINDLRLGRAQPEPTAFKMLIGVQRDDALIPNGIIPQLIALQQMEEILLESCRVTDSLSPNKRCIVLMLIASGSWKHLGRNMRTEVLRLLHNHEIDAIIELFKDRLSKMSDKRVKDHVSPYLWAELQSYFPEK